MISWPWHKHSPLQARIDAADNGAPVAQACLGYMYQFGFGVRSDLIEGRNWLRKAASQGNVWAQNHLDGSGLLGDPLNRMSQTEIVGSIRRDADRGDADAQLKLGGLYMDGVGVSKDKTEGVEWYRRAAENGDPVAQLLLGFMYYLGEGVPQDDATAAKWWGNAAEQGDHRAEGYLRFLLPNDRDERQQRIETMRACVETAERGGGVVEACLAFMYDWGLGLNRDADEAKLWLRRAAERGDMWAPWRLLTMHVSQYVAQGETEDETESGKWLHQAARRGHVEAQHTLALAYSGPSEIWSIRPNKTEAAKWLRASAAKGHPHSYLCLGFLHEFGIGVRKDYVEAYKWFNLAALRKTEIAELSRNCLATAMTPAHVSKAQHLAREWLEEHEKGE